MSKASSRAPAGRLAAALLALAAFAANDAHAALFDDDEARRRIEILRSEVAKQAQDNEARIARLEESIRNVGVVELVRQLELLNAEIARLRGQIEVLAHENQQIQKRQRDFYLDLDSRLKRLETAASAAAAAAAPAPEAVTETPPAPSASPATPGTAAAPTEFGASTPSVAAARPMSREEQAREIRAYDAASNLFRRNDFPAAIEAFRAFLRDYPASQLAPNASYWIGISYANLRDYRSALTAQQEVIGKYPQSAKAPDALLAIAAIQAEQGDLGSARNTLEDIIARFPSSDAAGKARTRLSALRR